MANLISGKVWSIDTTAAVITQIPVCIHSIRVRFTTAAAGSFIMTTNRPDVAGSNNVQEVLLDLKTTAASTAAVFSLDQQWFFDSQTFQGLAKTVCVNVDTVYIVTTNAK